MKEENPDAIINMKEFLSLINYYEKMLDKLGVHVELQKTPDKKMIKEGVISEIIFRWLYGKPLIYVSEILLSKGIFIVFLMT